MVKNNNGANNKITHCPLEEGNNMATAIEKKEVALKEMLSRISTTAQTLTGEDNMIELDPNNTFHKEWFDEEE